MEIIYDDGFVLEIKIDIFWFCCNFMDFVILSVMFCLGFLFSDNSFFLVLILLLMVIIIDKFFFF